MPKATPGLIFTTLKNTDSVWLLSTGINNHPGRENIHLFSRKMVEFDEDLSPVLLIIRDTKEHVFGAVVSGAIRPSDHYTGTGDSCLLWRFTGVVPHTRELRQYNWTGENQFFVNSSKDSLSIGAGGGHYGLWLDGKLLCEG